MCFGTCGTRSKKTKRLACVWRSCQIFLKRAVHFSGPPGIGKTMMVKQLCHFVLDRRMFGDGCVFVPLRGVGSFGALLAAFSQALGQRHALCFYVICNTAGPGAYSYFNWMIYRWLNRRPVPRSTCLVVCGGTLHLGCYNTRYPNPHATCYL